MFSMKGPLRFILPLPLLMTLMLVAGCAHSEKPNPANALYQISQGDRYYFGKGVEQDLEEAARWYNLAALQGNPDGEFYLGRCYSRGDGVPKDDSKAAFWYRKSAMEGNPDAQFQLGQSYELHEGVEQSSVKAYMWLNLSAINGNEKARESRDAIAERMTGAEIATAQRLSSEWSPK
jgi:hypothetical protein